MDVIKNCLITQSDARVLREFCIDKQDPKYKEYKGYNTSVNLEAKDVYAGYAGRVTMITGDARRGFELSVSMNTQQAIKYGNLKSVFVSMNQDVDIGTKIGEVRNWVSIEYLTTNVENSFPCRIGLTQMYKDDPMLILDSASYVPLSSSPQFSQSGLMSVDDEFDSGITSIDDEFTSIKVYTFAESHVGLDG